MATEAAKQRACDLANARAMSSTAWSVQGMSGTIGSSAILALAQYIQDVSDAVREWGSPVPDQLLPFALPEADPLAEALEQFATLEGIERECANDIRAHLEAAGYTITRKDVG